MNEKKKVIFINGNNSKWYEQVIFIIKEDNRQYVPKNLALEAEKIINDYMAKKYNAFAIENKNIDNKNNLTKKIYNKSSKNIGKYNQILNISILLILVFICYLLYQIYI